MVTSNQYHGPICSTSWLARNLILTRLTKSVEHEFGVKLATLRAQHREAEERLKAQLQAREAEVAALRSDAMTALASRQIAIDQRRLEAVDQLWSAVTALTPARSISATMSFIKFESAAKRAERDPKVRNFFDIIGNGVDPKSINLGDAAKARPFVSAMAWAIYSAMVAISMHAVVRLQVLRGGLGTKDFVDDGAVGKLIKVALPHHAGYIDQYGASGYHILLEELEAKLLRELQAMLMGTDVNKASIDQAAEILRQSNEVLKQADSDRLATQEVPSSKTQQYAAANRA